jgi:hypothetical protein
MSGDGAFMVYAGKRIEWQMVHPAFQQIFAFNIHGPSLCLDCGIHPQYPNDMEVEFVERTIRQKEEALV